MEFFNTSHFEGVPQPRRQGTRVTLAGRTAFLPNRSTPLVIQKLTLRQIAEIPRGKYAVAVIKPDGATVDILASSVGAVAASTNRRLRYLRNISRHRLQPRYCRRSAKGDGTQEYTTVISLLHQVQRHVETVEWDYPQFHLTLHYYWCHVESGHLELKEHEAAKWLNKNELESVNWLPADWDLVRKLRI